MAVNNTYFADGWPFASASPGSLPIGLTTTVNFRFTMANNAVLAASGFSANDIVKLCPLSQGLAVVIDEYFLDVPELDTATGVVSSLGDDGGASPGTTNAAIFQTGMTIGRGGSSFVMPFGTVTGTTWQASAVDQAVGRYYAATPPKQVYVTDTGAGAPSGSGGFLGNIPLNLILKIATAPTTPTTTGVIKGRVRYHAVGPFPLL